MNQNANVKENLTMLENKLNEYKRKYTKFIYEGEKRRKREQDVHFTRKDEKILITSFVVAGILEQGIRKIFAF